MVPTLPDAGPAALTGKADLRPPESWPGAAGLRSVAPEGPSWPSGPLPRAAAAPAEVSQRPSSAAPGESWPGASAAGAEPGPASGAAGHTAPAASTAPEGTGSPQPPHARVAMWQAIALLAACLALAAWVIADPASRVLQAAAVVLVLVTGGVIALRGMPRHR